MQQTLGLRLATCSALIKKAELLNLEGIAVLF